MKRYQSHKVVEAAKIVSIILDASISDVEPRLAQLCFEEGEPVTVNNDYMKKHRPETGGYYISYADGYESWSPAEAFESGYTEVLEADG